MQKLCESKEEALTISVECQEMWVNRKTKKGVPVVIPVVGERRFTFTGGRYPQREKVNRAHREMRTVKKKKFLLNLLHLSKSWCPKAQHAFRVRRSAREIISNVNRKDFLDIPVISLFVLMVSKSGRLRCESKLMEVTFTINQWRNTRFSVTEASWVTRPQKLSCRSNNKLVIG